MRMKDWLLAGFEPPFGTVDDWIADLIGRVGAEETAAFATRARQGQKDGIRVLVATDIGLFDFFWYRPEPVKERALTGRHVSWRDVRGLALTSETRLNEKTMLRLEPAWRLTIEEPAVTLEDAPSEPAILDFWSACSDGLKSGE
jgi:hypothetical protein